MKKSHLPSLRKTLTTIIAIFLFAFIFSATGNSVSAENQPKIESRYLFAGIMDLIDKAREEVGRVADQVSGAGDVIDDVRNIGDEVRGITGAGGGSGEQPGCGGGDCLVVPGTGEYHGISTETSFRESLIKWTNFFLGFLALAAMISLIFAGFLYVTSAGNDEQAGKAKKIIIWVVIGIVVILLAYAFVNTLIDKGPTGSDL